MGDRGRGEIDTIESERDRGGREREVRREDGREGRRVECTKME